MTAVGREQTVKRFRISEVSEALYDSVPDEVMVHLPHGFWV